MAPTPLLPVPFILIGLRNLLKSVGFVTVLKSAEFLYSAVIVPLFLLWFWWQWQSGLFLSLVILHCWFGVRKSIRPVKWWGVGVVICLKRGTDCLHMVLLMPLHPKTRSSVASFKSRQFYLSAIGLPGVVLGKRPLNGCSSWRVDWTQEVHPLQQFNEFSFCEDQITLISLGKRVIIRCFVIFCGMCVNCYVTLTFGWHFQQP